MSDTLTAPVADRFQTRDEIVSFIEEKATAAVEKAVQTAPRVERRVPWATSGPIGRDSEGYSVLKAAAFALGYIGADQAKEELHVHHQGVRQRELYPPIALFSRRQVWDDGAVARSVFRG